MALSLGRIPSARTTKRHFEIASPKALDHLDIVRGVAALAVVASHVRGLFFANWANVPNQHNISLRLLYFSTGLGRQAVIVFFVLSGFFIGWSVIGGLRNGRWSWRSYLGRRLTRLWIVLLPALLLSAMWDFAGIHLFESSSAYFGGRHGDAVLTFRVVDDLNVQSFFGNLFFLQGIRGIHTFGSNAPLWSLSYEFWYYMLLPLMLSAYLARGLLRWALAALTGLVLIVIGSTIASYYLIWLFGVAIVAGIILLGDRRRMLPGWTLIGSTMLLCLALVVAQQRWVKVGEAVLGLTCAVFLSNILLLSGDAQWSSRLGHAYSRLAKRLAGCSYTLYLVHLPILVFLRGALDATVPWLPNPVHLALGFSIFSAVLAYAFAIAYFTEARTGQFRRWVVKRLPTLA